MYDQLQQFKIFYESQLEKVDNEQEAGEVSSESALHLKLGILQKYIKDLGEQNLLLIQTAEELKESAEDRVKILEKILQKTTVGSQEYMQQLKNYHGEFQKNIQEKLELFSTVSSLQNKQEELNEENIRLKSHTNTLIHNLSLLIQLINNARSKGTWEVSSAAGDFSEHNIGKFLESLELSFRANNVEEIHSPGNNLTLFDDSAQSFPLCSQSLGSPSISFSCASHDDLSFVNNSVTEKDVIIKRLQIDLNYILKSKNDAQIKLLEKDHTIASLQSQIVELQHELNVKENECVCITQDLMLLQDKTSSKMTANDFNHFCAQASFSDTENRKFEITIPANVSTQTDLTLMKLHLLERNMNPINNTNLNLQLCETDQASTVGSSRYNLDYNYKSYLTTPSSHQLHELSKKSDLSNPSSDSAFDLKDKDPQKPKRNIPEDILNAQQNIHALSANNITVLLNDECESKSIPNKDLQACEMDHLKLERLKAEEFEQRLESESRYLKELNDVLVAEQSKLNEEIHNMKENFHVLELSAQENCLVLTQEIAEKHDTIKVAREELVEQKEQNKEIIQQLVMKTEIIKGLRREIKVAQTKIKEDEEAMEKMSAENIALQDQITKYTEENNNQKITICNLQEALIKSKRNMDVNVSASVTAVNGSSPTSPRQSHNIFDI